MLTAYLLFPYRSRWKVSSHSANRSRSTTSGEQSLLPQRFLSRLQIQTVRPFSILAKTLIRSLSFTVLDLLLHRNVDAFEVKYRDRHTPAAIVFSGVAPAASVYSASLCLVPHLRRVIPTENLPVECLVAIPDATVTRIRPPVFLATGVRLLSLRKLGVQRGHLVAGQELGFSLRCVVGLLNRLLDVPDRTPLEIASQYDFPQIAECLARRSDVPQAGRCGYGK